MKTKWYDVIFWAVFAIWAILLILSMFRIIPTLFFILGGLVFVPMVVFYQIKDARKKKFLHELKSKIPRQYTDKFGNVELKPKECAYIGKCQLRNMHIALLQDGERIILLGYCNVYEDRIYCDIKYVQDTKYKTIEEALADVEESGVRAIDSMAYNRWCEIHR